VGNNFDDYASRLGPFWYLEWRAKIGMTNSSEQATSIPLKTRMNKPLIRGEYSTHYFKHFYIWHSMVISFTPLDLPPSVDTSRFKDFGREVKGVHPGNLSQDNFKEIERACLR